MRKLIAATSVLMAFGLSACSSEPASDRTISVSPPPAVTPSTGTSSLQPSVEGNGTSSTAQQSCTFSGTMLNIPSIGVKYDVRRLKLNKDGELNPPKMTVGWDVRTPRPGKPGVSILAGHVRYDDPDVFANLHKIKKDSVIIVRQCRRGTLSEVRFVATSYDTIPKEELVVSNAVWNLDGSITSPQLRLITCELAPGFPNNFVVFAKREV